METPLSRTQIYLEADQVRSLGKVAKQRKSTQSALIREAIDEYLERHASNARKKSLAAFAGAFGQDAFSRLDIRALRAEERVR